MGICVGSKRNVGILLCYGFRAESLMAFCALSSDRLVCDCIQKPGCEDSKSSPFCRSAAISHSTDRPFRSDFSGSNLGPEPTTILISRRTTPLPARNPKNADRHALHAQRRAGLPRRPLRRHGDHRQQAQALQKAGPKDTLPPDCAPQEYGLTGTFHCRSWFCLPVALFNSPLNLV